MRSVRLGQSFDAVFVHDAIDYLTTASGLALAIGTAFAHCRHGGIAVFAHCRHGGIAVFVTDYAFLPLVRK